MADPTPPFQVVPPLSDEDYAALKADIGMRGVMVPVEYDDEGNVLDGHHRLKVCSELGIERWPRLVRSGFTDAEKRRHARQLNIARRHLDAAAKRNLIAADLAETPDRSDRQVAKGLGVDHKTVEAVRVKAEERGEIPHVEKRTDTKGRKQPAKKNRVRYVAAAAPNRTQFTGENEWFTPPEHIDLARKALGDIDLDPASSALAQETVRATNFFTREDDGLTKDWHGHVFLNPPYSQPDIERFVRKLVDEHISGRVGAAILLTHNYTDTAWFQKAAAHCAAICFTRGRVRFVSADGSIAAPTQGQAFFYFGTGIEAFSDAFANVGFIAVVRR